MSAHPVNQRRAGVRLLPGLSSDSVVMSDMRPSFQLEDLSLGQPSIRSASCPPCECGLQLRLQIPGQDMPTCAPAMPFTS